VRDRRRAVGVVLIRIDKRKKAHRVARLTAVVARLIAVVAGMGARLAGTFCLIGPSVTRGLALDR
jgi:hypothetical protein